MHFLNIEHIIYLSLWSLKQKIKFPFEMSSPEMTYWNIERGRNHITQYT